MKEQSDVRHFYPAPLTAKICISPFGASILYILVLWLCTGSGAAQTRLDSSQVIPLNGDAKGAFANTKLRDFNSAADHGNGVSNGIASAIVDCGVTISCSIIVPPSYATAEPIPGFQLNYDVPAAASTTPGNIALYDHRYGDARMYVNNLGFMSGLNSTPAGWLYHHYSKASPNQSLFSFFLRLFSISGGTNQASSALNYADKTTWATVLSNEISHTPGQHLNVGFGAQNTAIGDYVTLKTLVNCNGGFVTEGDLGCHAQDNFIAQGNVEYSGTVTGSPANAATALSISPNQGAFTQGAGRFLAKLNAGTITAGVISQVASPNFGPAIITGSGTSWPVSTVVATLGTDISNPGVTVVTPNSFTTGSMAALQTSSLVCVADQESFEMVYPSAVTTTTFTANFAKIHPSNAIVAAGGLCGYLFDLTADDVTNATYPAKAQTITGTLHFAWPMISSSATSAALWVTAGGGWAGLVTRWDPANANGYVLYPFAEVVSVQKAGGLSDNLTVGPNKVAWSAADVVSEFIYPSVHYSFGNLVAESYYPSAGGLDGYSLTYNAPLQGNEAMMSLTNNGPLSLYHSRGGRFDPPSGIHLTGPTTNTLALDLAAQYASIAVGCASPCTSTHSMLAASNGIYYDFLFYDEGGQRWSLSADNNSKHYSFGVDRFDLPFSNTYMANDSASNGYIATQQVRSNSSSNNDLTGELAFSNAATATQPLSAAYARHPECLARPQFDTGSTNRYWVTYTATSFTVAFAAAVTGTVTYSCVARN